MVVWDTGRNTMNEDTKEMIARWISKHFSSRNLRNFDLASESPATEIFNMDCRKTGKADGPVYSIVSSKKLSFIIATGFLSWASLIQCTFTSSFFKNQLNVILSFHINYAFQGVCILSGFPDDFFLYKIFISLVRAKWSAPLIILDVITLILFRDK